MAEALRPRIGVHAEDIDGISCAALLLKVFPEAEFRFLTPKEAETTEEPFDLVADIYKPKNAKVAIDHHKSNLEKLAREGRLSEDDLIDPDAPSAASLVAKRFSLTDEVSREIVEIANKADRGIFVSEETELLDLLIKAHVRDEGFLLKLARVLSKYGARFADDPWLSSQLSEMKNALQRYAKVIDETLKDVLARGVKVAIFDARALPYFVAKKFASLFVKRGGLVGISVYYDADKLLRASIRVAGGFEFRAEKLAEKFGGGGHEKAAGFYIRNLPQAIYELMAKLSRIDMVVCFVRPHGSGEAIN